MQYITVVRYPNTSIDRTVDSIHFIMYNMLIVLVYVSIDMAPAFCFATVAH